MSLASLDIESAQCQLVPVSLLNSTSSTHPLINGANKKA